jgi:hypothetical protein
MSFDTALATARDRLRFALGDTNPDAEMLLDATYDAMLEQAGSERGAGLLLVRGLIAKYAQMPTQVSTDGGKTQATWAERLKGWQALQQQWRAEGGIRAATRVKVRGVF